MTRLYSPPRRLPAQPRHRCLAGLGRSGLAHAREMGPCRCIGCAGLGSLVHPESFVLFIGRRLTPKDRSLESTSWDLAASTTRFFSFILMMPLPLGLAGYDWRGLIEKYGPGAFAAIIILVVAFVIANTVSNSLRRFGARAHAHSGADDTLIAFSASLIKYIIFAVAIVFALSQLGFPAASLAAVLGAAGLAIGLALQDTLKSVAPLLRDARHLPPVPHRRLRHPRHT